MPPAGLPRKAEAPAGIGTGCFPLVCLAPWCSSCVGAGAAGGASSVTSTFTTPALTLEPVRDFLFGPEPIVWLQRHFDFIGLAPFQALSLLGDTWGLLLAMGLTFWLWGGRLVYALIPLLLIEASTYLLLNVAIEIPRPAEPAVQVHEQLSMSAFPSGHTYLATVLWGTLYRFGRVRFAAAAAVAVGVAAGRLFLGTHHLADVLASMLLGAGLVASYGAIWPRLERRFEHIPFRAYLCGGIGVAVAVILALPLLGTNPRWLSVAGITAAAAIALPVEYGWIRCNGERVTRRERLLRVVSGASGLATAYYCSRVLPNAGTGAVLIAALATFWILVATPLLARSLALEEGCT